MSKAIPLEALSTDSILSDEEYQNWILPHVSRTFALTIPQLPGPVRTAVTTGYLLCRLADTIEDEFTLSADATGAMLRRFVSVLAGDEDPRLLTETLSRHLSSEALAAERNLIFNMERIVDVLAGLEPQQRLPIQQCVSVMCHGMHQFQRTASLCGLPRLRDLDDYCYYVAGVVGQMLTELFCSHSPQIARRASELRTLSVSFAQGLQMTNILKDLWEDRVRGVCWLPREVFDPYGIDLARLQPGQREPGFDEGMRELIGLAHAHLRNALAYALLIPAKEFGIRRFCLWAIGFAVLTLRKICRTPGFGSGAEVKISHGAVAATRLSIALVRENRGLQRLFERAARGLPLAPPADIQAPVRPSLSTAAQSADKLSGFAHGLGASGWGVDSSSPMDVSPMQSSARQLEPNNGRDCA